ncbi:hypothetical protein EDC96DRAFT_573280 [Choanephora cucurbitarum]|nr:hypothetical protein EDC96DRAFT_573280 [Choanephora cucurbitarum]
MEVDNEQLPIEGLTNYDIYMDLKPPKRLEKLKIAKAEIVADQVYNRGYKVSEAAKELEIPKRTAHCWFEKEEDAAQRRIRQYGLAQEEESRTARNS